MSFPVPDPLPSPSPKPLPPPVPPPAPPKPPPATTGDPDPARPSLTPAPPNWNYSGITPSEMTRFERDLGRAEDVLRAHEPRIREALSQVRLDTSPLAALREMGNWISAERPELRRRNETIQSLTTTWGADAPDMAPFDEARYQNVGQCSGLRVGGEGPRGKAPWGLSVP